MQNVVTDKNSDKKTASRNSVEPGDVNEIRRQATEAAQNQSANRQFMETKAKTESKKRGPYRTRNSNPEPQPIPQAQPQSGQNLGEVAPKVYPFGKPTAEYIKPFLVNGSKFIVEKTQAPTLALNEIAVDTLSTAYGACADKRITPQMGENADLWGCLIATVVVGVPWMLEYFRIRDERIRIWTERAKAEAIKNQKDENSTKPIHPLSV